MRKTEEEYYVKFKSFNCHTIKSLINKQIKFSNIYEFNDISEDANLNISNHVFPWDEIKKEFKKAQKKDKSLFDKIKDNTINSFELYNHKDLQDTANYKENLIKEFKKNGTNLEKYHEKFHDHLSEIIKKTVTGIFCLSSLEIFKDDAAILMLAHYANNANGIILIYRTKSDKIKKVEYPLEIKFSEKNEYIADNLSHKTKSWEYEKEYRIFGETGLQKAKNHNLELVGIFYLREDVKKFLDKINERFYNQKLLIEKIVLDPDRRDQIKYKFTISHDNTTEIFYNNTSAQKYLQKYLEENYSLNKLKKFNLTIKEEKQEIEISGNIDNLLELIEKFKNIKTLTIKAANPENRQEINKELIEELIKNNSPKKNTDQAA